MSETEVAKRAARRLAIIRHAEEVTGSVAKTCRYYGISRACFYKWRERYEEFGTEGLRDRSKRPHFSPKATKQEVIGKIIYLRQHYHFGPQRVAMYLKRYHDIQISTCGVWRILRRLGLNRLPSSMRYKRHKDRWQRYEKPEPGLRVQVDVKFISPITGTRKRHYQYTAIDDCTRYRILRFYLRKNQWTSHKLFTTLQTTLPFPIRKLQVDNINEVLKLMSGPLQAKHLNVRTTLSPEADRLHSDRDQIEQVLLNVIGNAIDASPMDELALEITAHEASREEHPGLMIQIRDAGEGVATAALARVFEPIFTSGKRNGTELGMAICKNIIERHRGDIHLTSAVGEGTIVSIWLPSTQDVQSLKG